jgi:LmbE family N-acetylglucosaminyl deacetylase
MHSDCDDHSRLLERLCGSTNSAARLKAAVVAAHPDDDVAGAGARIARLPGAHVVFVTDGSPRNLYDATRLGFKTQAEYAAARSREAVAALAIAGLPAKRAIFIGFTDQEASLNLIELSRTLARHVEAMQPDLILTHAYEGGHPDHDAAAFGVHAAAQILLRAVGESPALIEFGGYHAREGGVAVLEFLPHSNDSVTVTLDHAEREIKRRMTAAHETQRRTLGAFPVDREVFRVAPRYDFTQPPHAGALHYERYPWGMTGARFRALAAQALAELGLRPPI